MITNIIFVILFLFLINFFLIKDITSTLWFIKPMRKKYDIMASDVPKNISGKYLFLFFELVLIILNLIIIYFLNKFVWTITLIIHLILCIYYIYKYKNYGILEYVDWYSADLFDWDKIYSLNIMRDIKKQCFKIHNIDYDNYKETYLNNLEFKKIVLEQKIEIIKGKDNKKE